MAALTLRQDGKEVPCRKRSRYWAPPSSLRLRPAQWRGAFPCGVCGGGFWRPPSFSPPPAPAGAPLLSPALPGGAGEGGGGGEGRNWWGPCPLKKKKKKYEERG